MHIPDVQIEQVRAAANIVEVVSAHVPLKRKGQNHLGLCPFHGEKTPSFTVHEQKQIFHCFGCGVGGNVFSFVMKMENLDFPGAVRHLAERYGIPIAAVNGPLARHRRGERERVKRVNEMALSFFRQQLKSAGSDKTMAGYLQRRGIDARTADAFALGWAPDSWDALGTHLKRHDVPEADMLLAGVIIKRDRGGGYDRFRGRLIFPIHNAQGDVAGFGGRILGDGEPKYLNSPESPLYRKSELLYGLHHARQAHAGKLDRLVVVEGYMDVIACHMHGITCTVAPLGTALTETHARQMARHTDRVDLIFDGDRAGRAAARKAVAILAPLPLDVRVVTLPAGEDPDSLLRNGGDTAAETLSSGMPMMDFLIADCLGQTADQGIERRLSAAEPVVEVLGRMTDPVRKGYYAARLADALGVDEGDLRRRLGTRQTSRPQAARPAGDPPPRRAVPRAEAMLLHLAVQGRISAGWLAERLAPDAFSNPHARTVMQALADGTPAGDGGAGLVSRFQETPEILGLVTDWLSREVTVEGDAAQVAEECIRHLTAREEKMVRRKLIDAIRDAEAAGETGRLMALLRQKDALDKGRKKAVAG